MDGIAIDAIVKAYDIVAKRKPISVRTYGDTAYFYLPPSKFNFEALPLGGSDVEMVTLTGIESFEDKIVHQTISFDGGKLGINMTNNGNYWDCMVKLIDKNGKVAASLRTYDTPKEAEVNPGIYKITIQALALEGLETYAEIDNVNIKSCGITPVNYDFKSGEFQIYTKVGSEHIDAVVTIKESKTGTSVAGSRTYNRGAKFLLTPGSYQIAAAPLGNHKAKKKQTFTIEVKQGTLTTKEIIF